MSIVPLNKVHRDTVMREAGIHDWYAQAGYTVEFDEYSIEPEHKGFAEVDGVKRVFRVVSLDLEFEDDEGRESTLWDQVDRADEWYDSLPEDFDQDLARIGRKGGLTKGELAAVAWVMEGNPAVETDYSSSMGEALGVSSQAAKQAWYRARTKLRNAW